MYRIAWLTLTSDLELGVGSWSWELEVGAVSWKLELGAGSWSWELEVGAEWRKLAHSGVDPYPQTRTKFGVDSYP